MSENFKGPPTLKVSGNRVCGSLHMGPDCLLLQAQMPTYLLKSSEVGRIYTQRDIPGWQHVSQYAVCTVGWKSLRAPWDSSPLREGTASE